MKKILILYVFHTFNKRVNQFINNAIIQDENVDYIIISNDKNMKLTNLPSYVKTLYRDNIGYDFGGWSEALLTNNLYQNYEYFIFINSSVIGPYLPDNYKGKWYDIYINGLKNNVKLFGSSINTMSKPLTHSHVQTYVFSMDKNTLEYLIKCGIFSTTNYTKTFHDTIVQKEILMSRKIIEKGWNIGSLLPYYTNVDFTFSTKPPKAYKIKFLEDVMKSKYYGSLWNAKQLVFIKGNRNINFEGNKNTNFTKSNINLKLNKKPIVSHKASGTRKQNMFRTEMNKKQIDLTHKSNIRRRRNGYRKTMFKKMNLLLK